MSSIDYAAPATIHLGDEPNVRGSQQLVLSNFSTTAEAIKFVVEHLPRDLEGTCIMSAGQRLSGDRIARLYASNAFPLERRSRQSAAREADPAPTGSRAEKAEP